MCFVTVQLQNYVGSNLFPLKDSLNSLVNHFTIGFFGILTHAAWVHIGGFILGPYVESFGIIETKVFLRIGERKGLLISMANLRCRSTIL